MNSDHHFWIGSTHSICEDYALSGVRDGEPYAIVCDGCSSSPDTDFGARILAKAAERCVSRMPVVDTNLFAEDVLMQAKIIADAAQLHPHALDATLLVANSKVVRCYGDGVVAMIMEDGTIRITSISFASGAPLYINYLSNPVRYSEYCKEFGDRRTFNHIVDGSWTSLEMEAYPSDIRSPIGVEFNIPDGTKAVAIMSDGVTSIMEDVKSDTSKSEKSVPLEVVMQELLAFKNYQGVFAQRRARKFIKDCRVFGWQNTDDVSLAVVCRT